MLNGGPKVETMELRHCPLMKEPCVGEKCALWMRYEREDGTRFEACTFVLGTILQQQAVVELIRNQASADKVASNVHAGFDALTDVARHMGRRAVRGVANGG